ncbi:MAG: hypothetical protein QOD72_2626 [Acidimicrobiaceae bacterium]|nr:hypothetical protein [Acidimicrobiaceae bacterium]
MTPLEQELVDLGRHLDHDDGDGLSVAVRHRIEASPRRVTPTWVKVAAAVVLALAIAVALPPSRRALARWLGIGAVEIRPVATTLPPGAPDRIVPGSVPPGVSTTTGDALTAAGKDLTFTPLVAGAIAGPIQGVQTDPRVPGGLVVIAYERFALVELAGSPNGFPIMAKLTPAGVTITRTAVNGADALWIEGAHEIAYLGPDGMVRYDTVRRSGSVLLWTVGSVTVRIEGLATLDEASRVALTVTNH